MKQQFRLHIPTHSFTATCIHNFESTVFCHGKFRVRVTSQYPLSTQVEYPLFIPAAADTTAVLHQMSHPPSDVHLTPHPPHLPNHTTQVHSPITTAGRRRPSLLLPHHPPTPQSQSRQCLLSILSLLRPGLRPKVYGPEQIQGPDQVQGPAASPGSRTRTDSCPRSRDMLA